VITIHYRQKGANGLFGDVQSAGQAARFSQQ
jgi:hypothetical protein